MPRSKKSQIEATTAEEGMTMILDTPVEKSIDEAAKIVGVAEIRLLEMFVERLNLPEAMVWETIPMEHESLLTEFKQQQDAFNSVRQLNESVEVETTKPKTEEQQEVEPPILEEEAEPKKKRGGRPKKESTALTKTKSTKLKEADKKSQQLGTAEQQVKVKLHAIKGQKSGAQLATIAQPQLAEAIDLIHSLGLAQSHFEIYSNLSDAHFHCGEAIYQIDNHPHPDQ